VWGCIHTTCAPYRILCSKQPQHKLPHVILYTRTHTHTHQYHTTFVRRLLMLTLVWGCYSKITCKPTRTTQHTCALCFHACIVLPCVHYACTHALFHACIVLACVHCSMRAFCLHACILLPCVHCACMRAFCLHACMVLPCVHCACMRALCFHACILHLYTHSLLMRALG